jgi:hypothetical protein
MCLGTFVHLTTQNLNNYLHLIPHNLDSKTEVAERESAHLCVCGQQWVNTNISRAVSNSKEHSMTSQLLGLSTKFILCKNPSVRLGSSISIAARLRAGRSGFVSRQGQGIFIFATASRPVLGLTQSPTRLVNGALFAWVKWSGRKADHSPSSSAEVMNAWIHTSTPP